MSLTDYCGKVAEKLQVETIVYMMYNTIYMYMYIYTMYIVYTESEMITQQ